MKASRAMVCKLTVLAIGVWFVCSCKKSSDCDGLVAANLPGPIFLQFKNSQGKDLLDPATPGHYDTAYIKRQNPPWLTMIPSAAPPFKMAFNYISAQGNILVLSVTDQDTLHVSVQTITEKCNMYTKLTEFKYNNTVQKPDSLQGNSYIIHK
jgi:hypothetical protein